MKVVKHPAHWASRVLGSAFSPIVAAAARDVPPAWLWNPGD